VSSPKPTPDVIDQIAAARIVPVVVVDGAVEGLALADALIAGGLPIAEVTLRTPGALDALRAIAEQRPEILLGAGTVVSAEQVDQAVDAGAKFLVSPGTFEPVIRRAAERGVPILPGVANASDVMHALHLGIGLMKIFPASIVGGPAAIKALAAPFPQVKFLPTGGINDANLHEYLDLPAVLAVGGSWMVDRPLIASGDWAEITRRTKAATALVGNQR